MEKILKVLLAIALLAGLFFAGWRVYRHLPADVPVQSFTVDRSRAGALRVVVRNRVANARLDSPLELYPFDLVAARREFESSPRLARQFDDFLARRMHDSAPVKADVSGDGQAVALLAPGDWWLHALASLDTGEKIEWRLPVVVSDRDQAMDLSFENAYERTKKF